MDLMRNDSQRMGWYSRWRMRQYQQVYCWVCAGLLNPIYKN
jgi:hypothetical protein